MNNSVTNVITAFLWDGRRVLLALRSDRVSTYPRHWAGISGYLESDDPVEWALVEIREECGVARQDLTLRRVGEPLDATGEDLGRTFRVHPSLWSIDPGARLRTDWEASRFEWVDVDELTERRRSPAVPRLYDAFDAVWPTWDDRQSLQANLELSLRFLRKDRSMGAGTMARAAAHEVAKLVGLCSAESFHELRSWLHDAAGQLRVVRPSMVPPANLLADVQSSIQTADEPANVLDAINRLVADSERAEEEVADRAAAKIPRDSRVMTISFSSTVRRALLAAEKIARVYICEGRPLLEGRKLAEELAEAGIPVTLLTDAQAACLMKEVDLVFFGADAVAGGVVVNKVGSMQLALTARHFGKRVLVAAESLKFVRDDATFEFTAESNPPDEVWQKAPPGVDVSNVYFEEVPSGLVDELVTEKKLA